MSDMAESSKEILSQPIAQGSANTASADPGSAEPDSPELEATTSETDEDSAASELGCLSADEEENESEQKDLSYLCDRCLQVDFDDIFSRQHIEKGGDPILWFYSEHKVLDDQRCAFCQAMRFIHPSLDMLPEWKKQRAPLVVAAIQDNPTYEKEAGSEDGLDVTEDGICVTFAYHREPPVTFHKINRWTRRNVRYRHDHDFRHERVGYLAEKRTIESDKSALPAASIKPRVNFGTIKKRLKECREEHEICRSKRGGHIQKVPGMRLIDCRTRTVVPAPDGEVSYAALSYVWGTSGTGYSIEDGDDKLPDSLPNTISDAILVTRKLKIRYLWIDRYCIRQVTQTKEEKDEKHGQIARMHQIYGGASITIIAAAGDGPHHGLPGVRTKRRSPPTVRLPHCTLFATLPDPNLLVDTSAWSTRGWTFQEGLLARRRLVFTDQQVYFECGETRDAEAWEECHKGLFKGFDINQKKTLNPYFVLGNGGSHSIRIWPMIDDYVNLILGDQKDILNGILGVLTHYEGLSSIRHVAGLPIPWKAANSPATWPDEFAAALFWECEDPGKRRAGFPAWSWTGWTCKGLGRNSPAERLVGIPAERRRAWSISVERPEDESPDQSDLSTLLEGRNDLSQVKALRVTAPSLEAEIITLNGIPEDRYYLAENHQSHRWNADGFDNNQKTLGVRYSGIEKVSFINLTDCDLLKLPLSGKIQCSAITVDEDRLDISMDQLGKDGKYPVTRIRHATALLLREKENGFERIGISGIDRHALRRAGSVIREFRLI